MHPSVPPADDRVDVDGVESTSFVGAVARLAAAHPTVTVAEIERVVLREWEAFSAGRPLVIPLGVEDGADEMLRGLAAPKAAQ